MLSALITNISGTEAKKRFLSIHILIFISWYIGCVVCFCFSVRSVHTMNKMQRFN